MAKRVIEGAVYLDDKAAADAFLNEIGPATEIAVDTEGASFHKFLDRIYLLQLSTRQHSAIIDPIPTGKLERLAVERDQRRAEARLCVFWRL